MTYRQRLVAPVNVTWEITARCNLRCRHCLSAELVNQCDRELTIEECCRFIDDLDRMEVFQVNFGGGEPFLRVDFLDILDYAHGKQITTCVSTNGTLIDEGLAKRLAHMDYTYIQVSLDGATADTNDAIRGKGTYERVLSAVDVLVRHGFPHLSINTVVTRTNFKEIEGIYGLGRQYGVKTRLSRFRPSGNARRVWGEYSLDRDQLAELSQFLNAHTEVLTGDSFFSITGKDRREMGLNMCGAAKMTCSVTPDGTVYPCAFLQEGEFRAGNVTETSLGAIWRSAPPFEALREMKIASCERCGRFDLCHGGCPAVAYFLTRSLSRPDPECLAAFQRDSFVKESPLGASDHARTV